MQAARFVKYIIGRALILFAFLVLLTVLFTRESTSVSIGMSVGLGAGIIKLRAFVRMLEAILSGTNRGPAWVSIVIYLIGQVLAFIILLATAYQGREMFFGAAAGLLHVPLIISFYCITRGLGIFRRDFI